MQRSVSSSGSLARSLGREVVKALGKIGYELDRQHGSHMNLRHPDPPFRRLPSRNPPAAGSPAGTLGETTLWLDRRGLLA